MRKLIVSAWITSLEKAEWKSFDDYQGECGGGSNAVEAAARSGNSDRRQCDAGAISGAAGLIDEYRFLVHPAIMGEGKRFFKDGMHARSLRLVRSQELDQGVMLLCYEPKGSSLS